METATSVVVRNLFANSLLVRQSISFQTKKYCKVNYDTIFSIMYDTCTTGQKPDGERHNDNDRCKSCHQSQSEKQKSKWSNNDKQTQENPSQKHPNRSI